MEKNQVLKYISTNNITEINELIHAGVKLVYAVVESLTKGLNHYP